MNLHWALTTHWFAADAFFLALPAALVERVAPVRPGSALARMPGKPDDRTRERSGSARYLLGPSLLIYELLLRGREVTKLELFRMSLVVLVEPAIVPVLVHFGEQQLSRSVRPA